MILGKLSRDSSPASSQHFDAKYGEDFSNDESESHNDGSGSEYQSNTTGSKLRKKLLDIQLSKSN